MNIDIPEFSMVMMIGPTGSGKSTIAKRNFDDSEVISSDQCRYMVADNPNDQTASVDAFKLVHFILNTRLKNRRLSVIDATNLEDIHRRTILDIAKEHHCQITAVVLDIPMNQCIEQSANRAGHVPPERVVRHHYQTLNRQKRKIRKEPFHRVHYIKNPQEANEVCFTKTKMRSDLKNANGPFDIIGDVHGCHDELVELLETLGYKTQPASHTYAHPDSRTAIFLGDIVDRGPGSDKVLELVMDMTDHGSALCIMGNHENKLMRKLRGNNVQVSHGLTQTLEQIDGRDQEFRDRVLTFLNGMTTHYILDEGKLAVAHAGITEEYQGRTSSSIRDFCMYGKTDGEKDAWGLPNRLEWANEYRGKTLVVFGHTSTREPRWLNNTVNIDTGCVFGGKLTALQYPEVEIVSVPARATYYEPVKPLDNDENEQHDKARTHILDIKDVTGDQFIHTRTHGTIRVPNERANAALETMSRFAIDHRWLVYMPPTISPTETSSLPDYLERPEQAFEQYQRDKIDTVICEEKHMGSRGIIVVGRTPEVIKSRFNITSDNAGICYSRNGNRFFGNPETEATILARTRQAIDKAGLWEELKTDWLIMDCEIMPWSLKAFQLIRNTYAPTGAAAVNTLSRATELLNKTAARGLDTTELSQRINQRLDATTRYREAYNQYCWEVESPDDIQIAPFHIMAAEGQLFTDRPHTWHMATSTSLHQADPNLFKETQYRVVNLNDLNAITEATEWWESMTNAGGEGMVVKPVQFIPEGRPHASQPAVKVRGQKYLSIIYGPEYDLPENIAMLRRRGLSGKRNAALREFALGIEGLQRFVEHEPMYRVHQCAYGVMALESEPLDPRL